MKTERSVRIHCVTLAFAMLFAVGLWSCAKPELGHIEVSPGKKTVVVGETLNFDAKTMSTKNEPMTDVDIQWSVEGDAGTIDDKGMFTAKKPGEATVIATANMMTGRAQVTVEPPKVAKLQVQLEAVEALTGAEVSFTVKGLTAEDKPAGYNKVSLSSPTTGVSFSKETATLSETGKAELKMTLPPQPGTATIIAALDGVKGEAQVTVKPWPVEQVQVKYDTNRALAESTITVRVKGLTSEQRPAGFSEIQVSSPTRGTSLANQTLTLDQAGEAELKVGLSPEPGVNTVVLKSGETTKELQLEGTKITVLEILPKEKQFEAGQKVTFKAVGSDAYGNSRPVDAQWSLTGEDAKIEEGGTVSMLKPGSGVVLAEYKDISQGQPITIVPGQLARIQIEPSQTQLKAGETTDFDAQGFNAQGIPVSVHMKWSVAGEIGSVAQDGVFSAKSAGQGFVKASSGEVSVQATVEVSHGSTADIEIQIEEKKLTAGEKIPLESQGMDAFGNKFDIKPRWSLSKALGTINQKESTFTPLHAGTGEIRAEVGNVLKGAAIEVVPAELAKLQISPSSVDVLAGETIQFDVKGFDQFGNSVEIQPSFSILEPLGELGPTGTLSAQKSGNTVVRVQVNNITAVSTVAIAPAMMEKVIIAPEGPVELVAGKAREFVAYGMDRFDNTVQSSISWKISPDLGSIDDQGVLLPKKAGKGRIIAAITQLRTAKTLQVVSDIVVNPGQTTRIEVLPAKLQTTAGDETVFSATAYDEFGNKTGAPVTWTLAESSLGGISQEGNFKARKAETGKVLASHGNVVGAATVEIKPAEIAFLKIIPEAIALKAGQRVELKAVGEDRFGNVVDADVLWSLSDPSLGKISPDNVLIVQKQGKGNVVAASGDIVDLAPLTVQKGSLATITIEPFQKTLASGTSFTFHAEALDPGGNPLNVAPAWSVDHELGTVDEKGAWTAGKVGRGQIVASSGDVHGIAEVEVIPGKPASIDVQPREITTTAGETTALSCRIYDTNGNLIPDPAYQWKVEDELGSVSAANEFHARKAGQGFVRLVAGEISVKIPVTVNAGEVYFIKIEPNNITLAAGVQTSFSATAFDSQGNQIPLEGKWSVGAGVGKVDQKGVFEAIKSGKGYVSVQMKDVTGVAAVTVEPGPVARVVVEPSDVTLRAGETMDFAATAFDAQSNVTPAEFSWFLEAEKDLGQVNETGAFKAMKAGKGLIVARADEVNGSARVSVKPADLARIVLSPEQITLKAGGSAKLSVVGVDTFGNAMAVDPQFSVDPAELGTIGSDGVFTARRSGTGQVTAAVDNIEAFLPVEVSVGGLAGIRIKVSDEPIIAGKTYRFQAVGSDQGGNEVRVEARWAVTPDIGRIDQSTGRFSATKTGTGLVVAYVGDIVSEKQVRVEPGELYNLFVEPNPVTVKSGTIQEFTLNGLDVEENKVSVSAAAAKWSTTGGIGVFQKPAVFRGTKIGKGKVMATIGNDLAEAYVTVIPGEPDPANSRIRVTYPTLPADGSTFSEVIVEVRDSHGNPVPEAHVTLVSSRQLDNIVKPPATNQQGLARGQISSKEAGSSVVRAIVEGATFPDTAEVTFK